MSLISRNTPTFSKPEVRRQHLGQAADGGLHLASGGNIELLNGAAEFGTSDFSVEFILNQDKENTSESYIYVTHLSGNNRLLIFHDVSDDNLVLDFRNNSGSSTKKDLAYDMNQDFGSPTHYVLTADRSGNATLYKNGNSVASVDISSLSAINIGDGNTTAGRIGTALTDGLIGSLYRFRTYNKALTQAEVDNAYQRADVDFADQYGSQTDLVAGYNFKTDSNPEATIGDMKFQLFTSGSRAWSFSPSDDEKIIKYLKSSMKIWSKSIYVPP